MFAIEADLLLMIFHGGLLLFLIFAVGALWYRMGNVLNRLGRVEAISETTQEKTDAVRADTNEKYDAVRADTNEKYDAVRADTNEKFEAARADTNEKFNAVRADMSEKFEAMRADTNEKYDAVRSEMNDLKDTMVQMQLQMQRNHYQIMMAVLSHSHRADGRPVFDLPPDLEPPDAGE